MDDFPPTTKSVDPRILSAFYYSPPPCLESNAEDFKMKCHRRMTDQPQQI